MTRKERAKYLNQLIIPDLFDNSQEACELRMKQETALRETIAELMQEPCEDAISRQAAIDLADELKDDLPDDDRLSDMVMSHNEGILEYQTKLSLLPSVTPAEKVGRWIPVSERLPEVMDGTNGECSDDVLICVEDDEQITISTGFYGYYPRSKSQQGWWSMWAYGCHQLDSKYKVVAWMPLPEPYKASPTGAEGSKE